MFIGIIGAGVMGTGIAQAFASSDDYRVILCDQTVPLAQNGKQRISTELEKDKNKGKCTQEQATELLNRIRVSDISQLEQCDLVIEAIKEDLKAKQALFQSLIPICHKNTIFASNTSALSLTDLSEGLDRPAIGIHFFNPVSKMQLVEVVRSDVVPQSLCNHIVSIISSIGKTPVIVKNRSGFIVNRILIPMINEAIGIYAEGTATAEDIDIAMKLGANHPIGPLALGDLIGLDVCLAIMEVLDRSADNEKYRPHPLLTSMVEKKRLGRKTGCGFYNYN